MHLFESPHDFTTTLRKALAEIDPQWETYPGIVVPGSHTPNDTEEKFEAIKKARESGTPALLICFGYQLAVIEWCRNVLGIADATSEEFGKPEGIWVIRKREKGLKVGEGEDGETYWSNYDAILVPKFPRWFFATSFHPEYNSSITHPHPVLVNFLNACRVHGSKGRKDV